MLNYEYPPLGGGAANATAYLLEQLSMQNVEVDLVTTALGRHVEVLHPWNGVRVVRLPAPIGNLHYQTSRALLTYTLRTACQLPLLLGQRHYDLTHAFFALPCGALAHLIRHRVPYIISTRGSDVPGFNPRFARLHRALHPLNRRIWERADAVVANSAGLRDLALRSFPDLAIDVIPNGIDTTQFQPRLSPSESGPLRLLCVARLTRRKGINYLLDALAAVRQQGRQVVLDVVGDGQLRDELKAHAMHLGLGDVVTWHGYVAHEQLPELYARADAFVLPSLHEGMSNTVLEAVASGLPIIMTNTGGASELVSGNGYIVPSEDASAIADRLLQLADDAVLRHSLGQRSRELAMNMNWASVGKAYVQRYEAVRRRVGCVASLAR